MKNWLKKFILLIQTNKTLKKRLKKLIKQITDTCRFIVIQDCNRLTKINFTARMAEASSKP